ncbi:hypothetical protein BD626DRAFT_569297 [Schizophyllum amplum]|uniref:AAA-ATPase-like domain-containing protein n=1 Tax=Schizophyllum amplum TaxID=97359 RepID=A0A550CEN2_9AGAR|nr:hypothetical protein BD626DRAFT_569297 [Auriculariopsis ampla]
MTPDEDLRVRRVLCFFLDHEPFIFMPLRNTRLLSQRDSTFADVYNDVQIEHSELCRCGGVLEEVRISPRRLSDLEGKALRRPFAASDIAVDMHDEVIPALARYADGDNRQSIVFALTPPSPATYLVGDTGSSSDEAAALARPPVRRIPLQWITDSVCRPQNVNPRLPSPTDHSFLSLREHRRIFIDKSAYIPLLHLQRKVCVIRRPSGYGRSVLLSLAAELHDVISPTARESIWSRIIAESDGHKDIGWYTFVPNINVVLHMDMACLDVTTTSTLEQSITNMLYDAVTRFLNKYRDLLQLSDSEMSFALASNDATDLLLRATIKAQRRTDRTTYLCIDNYTAPFEKNVDTASEDWSSCTSILDRRLYEPIMYVIRSGNIVGGVLVGTSALDDHGMTVATYSRPLNDAKLNYAYCDPPPLVPFTGKLSRIAKDMTGDPRMQSAVGMTREEVIDLANACLRPSQLPRVLTLLEKLPSKSFVSWEWDAVNTYGSADVVEMLRGLQSEDTDS